MDWRNLRQDKVGGIRKKQTITTMKLTALICTHNPDMVALNRTVKSIKDYDKTIEVLVIDNCSDMYVPKIKNARYFKLRKYVEAETAKEMGVLLSSGDFVMFFKEGQSVSEWDFKLTQPIHRCE